MELKIGRSFYKDWKILGLEDWLDIFPATTQQALPWPTLDCSTIVLAVSMGSCGPPPFRFELMWLRKMALLIWLVVGKRGFMMTGKGFFLKLKIKLKEWKY